MEIKSKKSKILVSLVLTIKIANEMFHLADIVANSHPHDVGTRSISE